MKDEIVFFVLLGIDYSCAVEGGTLAYFNKIAL